jgi:predicted NBD/HSP70 family sugar kinase
MHTDEVRTRRLGGSLRDLRLANAGAVVEAIATSGPLHRAEIARRLDVSRSTMTTVTRELIQLGVLQEVPPDNTDATDGRAGDRLALVPHAGWTAGMSQVLDQIAVCVSDLTGNVLASSTRRIGPTDPWQVRARISVEVLDEALESAGGRREQLLGIGIGLPGQIDPREGIVHGALPDQPWNGINARAEMASRLRMPLFIENNVRLEAVAEARWGAARDRRNVLYVNLSSGLAAGILIDGQLHRGAAGGAGELGHMSVDVNGPPCRCGNRGCAVIYAGSRAIVADLRQALGPDIGMDDVLQSAAAGHRAARTVLADAGVVVGRLLASVCNLLSPELVVIGGETAKAGEILLTPLRRAIEERALAPGGVPDVIASDLGGPEAGAAGGAALVLAQLATAPGMLEHLLRRPSINAAG